MYLMMGTRPDLSYPLSILAGYVAPGRNCPEHYRAATRPRRTAEPRCPSACPASTSATTATAATAAMAEGLRGLQLTLTFGVLTFDHEGRPIQFDTWLDDLQLYLLSDSRDSVSLFDHTSGASLAPPAIADSVTRSQWLTRDAAARLASLDPTDLTVDLLEQHHLAAEKSVVAVGAACGTPRTRFFEGCSPSPLAPSYASAAAVDILGTADAGVVAAVVAAVGEVVVAPVGVVAIEVEMFRGEVLAVAKGNISNVGARPLHPSTFVSGLLSVGRLGVVLAAHDAWRAEFGDEAERPRWAELIRSGVDIFALDYDAILAAMYALSLTVEGDCYLCLPPDLGIEAAALGASESALPGTARAEALHKFTLDSGASRYFFRDSTTLTPLLAPVPVRLADPSGGPVPARSSTVLPCPAVPSGSLSGLHLPLFSTNLTLLWHHRLGHPSLPCLRGMHSRLLFSGLPRSLPPLPPSPAPPCLPCVEGRQRAAPHSSSFPPKTAPLQILHMDVWGPARVSGQGRERYFPLVVDEYTRYTTVFPLRSKGEVPDVLIPWIRAVRLQLRERFRQDLPVLRPHSDRSGNFRRIGLVMEVARTSMIRATAPHFLWPFAVWYAAHQLNLWSRVSLLETSLTLRWTGNVGDAPVFRLAVLPFHLAPCPPLSGGLFPFRSAPLPPPLLFLAPGPPRVDPLPPLGPAPSGVSLVDPLPGTMHVEVAVDLGATRCAAFGVAEPARAEPGDSEPVGAEPGGAKPEGAEPGGAECEGAESGAGDSAVGGTGAGGAGATSLGGVGVPAGAGGPGGAGGAGAGGSGLLTLELGVLELPGLVALGALAQEALEVESLELEALAPAALELEELELETLALEVLELLTLELDVQALGVLGLAVLVLEALCSGAPFLFRRHRRLCRHVTQSFARFLPDSQLPTPSPYAEETDFFTQRHEPESRSASPVRTGRRVPRPGSPAVPGTHVIVLRPSSVPLRVHLPPPPESSLPAVPDPESDLARAASPTVTRLLATVIIDLSFESTAASTLVAELVDFAAACRLDYAASLVAES
ncbi:unnamed protein product [Closterium sp. NIES-53]